MTTKLLIALDYEIYFGDVTGSVRSCLISPVDKLLRCLDQYDAKVSMFVDAGYLLKLRECSDTYPVLSQELNAIEQQLKYLVSNGHDVQLHIHPHWEDCNYNGESWDINTSRYRLHDFTKEEIKSIVMSYKRCLEDIVGNRIFAFRAGGWCIQPFGKIKDALYNSGIWLDSTVYYKGKSEDTSRWYDFGAACKMEWWHFNDDPCIKSINGKFVEVPITSVIVTPFLFWKMLIIKIFSASKTKPFGDGRAMPSNWRYYLSRLTSFRYDVLSIDGIKSSALKKFNNSNKEIINIIGHPKSLTQYSLEKLDEYLKLNSKMEYITFQDLKHFRDIQSD